MLFRSAAREMVRTVEHPLAGAFRTLGPALRFSATPTSIRRAPPTLGEHTEAILREELGCDAARIAQLRAQGVV